MPTAHNYRNLALKQLVILNQSEKQLFTFSKVMKHKASSPILKVLIGENEQNTLIRIRCLEEVLSQLPAVPTETSIEGINGIMREGFTLLKNEAEPDLIDVSILHVLLLSSYYKLGSYQSVLIYFNPAEFEKEFRLIKQAYKLEEYNMQETSDMMLSHHSNQVYPFIRQEPEIFPEKLNTAFKFSGKPM